MTLDRRKPAPQPADADLAVLDEVIGYLNFSSGREIPGFCGTSMSWSAIEAAEAKEPVIETLRRWLLDAADRLQRGGGAFANVAQARSVVELATDPLLKAYREFHRDLLHHQSEAELWRPFFLGEACEAVLAQGPPWNERERIVEGAIDNLTTMSATAPRQRSRPGRAAIVPHEYVRRGLVCEGRRRSGGTL
jgi:hypothetical protein